MEIRAVEVTSSNVGDAPSLPESLDQIPGSDEIATVAANGAYGTGNYLNAISERGTADIILPHRNAKPWKVDCSRTSSKPRAVQPAKLVIYLGDKKVKHAALRHKKTKVFFER